MKRKVSDPTEIVVSDLRALLFWASVGVSKSGGGSYQDDIGNILESYADYISFKLPYQPKFYGKRRILKRRGK